MKPIYRLLVFCLIIGIICGYYYYTIYYEKKEIQKKQEKQINIPNINNYNENDSNITDDISFSLISESNDFNNNFKKNKDLLVSMDISISNRNAGQLIFKLYHDTVPRTVANFAKLIRGDEGFGYKNSIFHRIIPNFMAQGGDFERGDGTGGYSIYGKTFADENFKINHSKRGQLSMANSGPHTNGSQFFILFKETPHLNGKHVVFGEMIDGWNTLDIIEQLGSDSGETRELIKITNCRLIEN